MRTKGIVVLLFCYVGLALGKRYMRCELARKLLESRYNFSRSDLPTWICLAEYGSRLDSDKTTTDANGSLNYGLFQINSQFCREEGRNIGREPKCNVPCGELLNENQIEAAACAKRIQADLGFQQWPSWTRSCSNPQNRPNLKVSCGI